MLSSKILTIRREMLAPHPLLENHPTASARLSDFDLGKTSPDSSIAEVTHFREIASDGLLDPLDVCEAPNLPGMFWILDGRHRMEGSDAMEFVCRVHAESEAEAIIAARMFDRRKITSQQKAWFIVCTWPQLASEKNVGGRPPKNLVAKHRFSQAGFEERYNVSRKLIGEAIKTYQLAIAKGCLREWSAKIWAGCDLGALRAGLAGKESTKGHKRNETQWVLLANRNVKSFLHTFNSWESIPDSQKEKIEEALISLVKSLPVTLKTKVQEEVIK